MAVVTAASIVDAIAIADIEAGLSAVAPDGVLDEPRKYLWKGRIEGRRVDLAGDAPQNVSAAPGRETTRSVGMISCVSSQNPGPMQEIVDQGVDNNEARPNLK